MSKKPMKVEAHISSTVREWTFEQDYSGGSLNTTMGAVLECHDGIPYSLSFFQSWKYGRPEKPPRITLKGDELAFFVAMFRKISDDGRILEDLLDLPAKVEVRFEGERSKDEAE